MNVEQARRLASNELLFGKVNEELVRLNEVFERAAHTSMFVCECSSIECVEQVLMTLAEYARVRSNPRLALVAPSEGHVVPEIEQVVERTERFFVVEKTGIAGEVAERRRGSAFS
jgi:hypothetical protein